MRRLAGLLTWLLCAGAAVAQADGPELQDPIRRAHGRWLDGPLLQPLRAPEPEAADAAWAAAIRPAVLAAVRRLDLPRLLRGGPFTAGWDAIAVDRVLVEGLALETRPVTAALPAWLQDALRLQVAALSLPAGRPSEPLPSWAWVGSGRWSEADDVNWSHAAVWAGPAVRDGVARYRSEAGQTHIRLAIGDPHALWRLAQARGAAVRVTLDDGGAALTWDAALPLRLETQLPVWLVTPQELLPATLTALRTGDACDGGYTELRLAGERQPAVWAVLFLPDAATGRAARVSRIAAPKEHEEPVSSAQQTRYLELSWPDRRLPSLHLVAKRFGDVWGTYAQPAGTMPRPDQIQRLSAAGSPACAPR